jgi:hypothetical protein
MKKIYAIIISLLFVGNFIGVASILGVQYSSFGTNTYKVYETDYNWIEIKDTGTEIASWDTRPGNGPKDNGYKEIEIGFNFPFYGQNYDTLYLSTNGHIDFAEGDGNVGYNEDGEKIPSETEATKIDKTRYWGENPLIAFFFCDLDFTYDGNAYYQNFGDYFVVEYYKVQMNRDTGSAGAHTMQVILYKNGDIKIQHKSLSYLSDWCGNNAVVGLDLDDVTGVSYDGVIKNEMALRFTTSVDTGHKSLPMAQIARILKLLLNH